MLIRTSANNFYGFSTLMSDNSPRKIYESWCESYQLTDFNKSDVIVTRQDDTSIHIDLKHPVRNHYQSWISLCSEGGIGFGSMFSLKALHSHIPIPNVARMYYNIKGNNHQLITFHPEGDQDITDVVVKLLDHATLIFGTMQREHKVQFAIKITENGFEIAIQGNANIPVYFNDFSFDFNLSSQHKIAQMTANNPQSLIIACKYIVGYLSGKVIGKRGEPAKRRIIVHNRKDGMVVGSTESGDDGNFVVGVETDELCYIVSLDNDEPPTVNSLIFDRVQVSA